MSALVEADFIQYNYRKINTGQTVNGTLQGRYVERSKIECSLRYDKNSHNHGSSLKDKVRSYNMVENSYCFHDSWSFDFVYLSRLLDMLLFSAGKSSNHIITNVYCFLVSLKMLH